jgi:adenosylhomocysteine nucleosidase
MICFAFAVPHESAGVIERLTERDTFHLMNMRCTTGKYGKREVVVAEIGMGLSNARENLSLLLQYFRVKCIIHSGYGGALVPQLKKNQIVLSKNYSSPEFLTFVRLLSGFDFGMFCSVDRVVSTPEDREQIHRITEAQVVDMETAAAVEIARQAKIPFLAIRVITDEAESIMPAEAMAASFDTEKNAAKPLNLMWHFVKHPKDYKPFIEFVKGLEPARKALTDFLFVVEKELPPRW